MKSELQRSADLPKAQPILPDDRRLSRDAVASLLFHACFQFGASMSSVFLNLYLWRLTHSLWVNGMYNIILYALTPVCFALGGWLIRRTHTMFVYRLGVFCFAVFYLLVVLAGKHVAVFYAGFAVLNAIVSAFYWTAYLSLMYDVSTDRNRIRYLAFNSIFFTTAGLIGPALAGYVITRFDGLHGYIIVFMTAFVMFALTTLGSFSIRSRPVRHRMYFLKFAGRLLKKNNGFRRALYAYYWFGLLQGLMMFLPNLLLFHVLPREDGVGYFGVLFSGAAILTSFFLARYANDNRTLSYMAWSAVGYTVGVLFLFGAINLWTVIVFLVVYSCGNAVQGNMLSAYYYRLIGELPLKGKLQVESMVIREAFVNIGRITSIGILISVSDGLDGRQLVWVLLIACLLQFVTVWVARNRN